MVPEMGKTGEVKKASSLIASFLKIFFIPALYLIYRFRFDRKTSKHINRPCVILCNHTNVIDQFVVGVGFRFAINFVASDSIFRYGLLSRIMVALVQPIPFSKGSSDLIAVRNMFSVIKQGGAIAMFPSGNRSFFGDECTIVGGIGKLVKKLNAPLVLVQIRGGYNTKARWKVKTNRGKMTAGVTKVINTEELASMSNEEVDKIIQQELNHNEFEYNKTAQIIYRGRHKAEYLESVLFYCPQCSDTESLCSKGNDFYCRKCGMKVRINDTGFFEKTENAEKTPETILEWGRIQLNYFKGFDFSPFKNEALFKDSNISLFRAERAKKEYLLGEGSIELYEDKFNICGQDFPFTETTTAIQGVRKFTVYRGNEVFAVYAPYRTNFMKYMICNYHLRNKKLETKEEYYGY